MARSRIAPAAAFSALAALVAGAVFPGLLSAAAGATAAPPAPRGRTVAVTVDDLSFVGYGLPIEGVKPLSRSLVAAPREWSRPSPS